MGLWNCTHGKGQVLPTEWPDGDMCARGGWDPLHLSPFFRCPRSPQVLWPCHTGLQYRYKCLFYIKISQNGQLVVPRPLVTGWRRSRSSRRQHGQWSQSLGGSKAEGSGHSWPRPTACTGMHTPCLPTRRGQGARSDLKPQHRGGEGGSPPWLAAEYCIGDASYHVAHQ